MKLQYLDVLDPKNIETAFQAAGKGRSDAVLVLSGANSILSENRLQNRGKEPVPAMYFRQNLSKTEGL